jgi:hypothetical protein
MDATEAAVHFARALEAAHVPYAIGGAIAYGFFGAARGTHDVDINLFVTGEAIAPAIDTLVQAGLSLDTAVSLASATERGDARGSFQGLPVDLFFNSIPVHERAAKRTREVTLHGTKIRVLSHGPARDRRRRRLPRAALGRAGPPAPPSPSLTPQARTAETSASTDLRASPKSMRVFSRLNSGFSTPA